MEKIDVLVEGARTTFECWIATRGGVVRWRCLDIGSANADIFTPHLDLERRPMLVAPHWSYGDWKVHQDIGDFRFAAMMHEVARFKVTNQRGEGLRFNLTDASKRKLERAMKKAGPEATYYFDYETDEVVIRVPVWEK